MQAHITHAKNPVLGWDIAATAKADKGEAVARGQIFVNGFAVYDEQLNPPVSNWQAQLIQKGQFPGNNEARLIVTDQNGQDTVSIDSWG